MKIAILNLSAPYAPLDQHGTADQLIERWLAPHLATATFTGIQVAAGEPLPTPANFGGYVISGSEKGVYDECDWMEPLKLWLRQLRAAGIPMFGICFGHQVMAEAFGGKAEKADLGMVVGVRHYKEQNVQYTAHAMHQDQVVHVPESATVTASATYCPVAALAYDFPARSVQFHPEFQRPLVDDAIEAFEGNLLSGHEAQVSRESMADGPVKETLYAREIAAFFRNHQ